MQAWRALRGCRRRCAVDAAVEGHLRTSAPAPVGSRSRSPTAASILRAQGAAGPCATDRPRIRIELVEDLAAALVDRLGALVRRSAAGHCGDFLRASLLPSAPISPATCSAVSPDAGFGEGLHPGPMRVSTVSTSVPSRSKMSAPGSERPEGRQRWFVEEIDCAGSDHAAASTSARGHPVAAVGVPRRSARCWRGGRCGAVGGACGAWSTDWSCRVSALAIGVSSAVQLGCRGGIVPSTARASVSTVPVGARRPVFVVSVWPTVPVRPGRRVRAHDEGVAVGCQLLAERRRERVRRRRQGSPIGRVGADQAKRRRWRLPTTCRRSPRGPATTSGR